ncbi:E3 ubiquitin-protein ligase uhrf1 [Plakobranchus ocellatus]|uniref:E3 ubiquitin-protein ligase uhrf1 n=1 Tax=Plakobranchus ocellatus TaxID=259542 RepID=A0AAV4AJY6_9GAST|nr:E3 ubiquitin-protein ligase uhrf1 [Plakobranchus ocellatus]
MWIQVRLISGAKTVRVDKLSKLTKIEELRERLVKSFDVEPERQRLFFRGKQMEDGHTLFDYDVGLNDLIQMLVRHNDTPKKETDSKEESPQSDDGSSSDKENKEPQEAEGVKESENKPLPSGHIYKVGDIIDARDVSIGSWFEAKIKKIEYGIDPEIQERLGAGKVSDQDLSSQTSSANQLCEEKCSPESQIATSSSAEKAPTDSSWKLDFGEPDGFTYHVFLEEYPEDILKVLSTEIKPRARTLISFDDVTIGQHIMANYNYEDPEIRGFWYDCLVTDKRDSRTKKELLATVYVGPSLTPLHKCRLLFVKELFGIEIPGTQITEADISADPTNNIETRKNQPQCDHCNDNPRKKCKHCGCSVCAEKKDPEKTILCDECDDPFHIYCLNPPLEKVPEEDECPQQGDLRLSGPPLSQGAVAVLELASHCATDALASYV